MSDVKIRFNSVGTGIVEPDTDSMTDDDICLSLAEPLTERELDVLSMIAAGMSNKEIAYRLQLTVNTVKTHVLHIYGKLRVNRRVLAVTRARELRLLKTE